jgi:polar amino acid transport system substrate-binding protein
MKNMFLQGGGVLKALAGALPMLLLAGIDGASARSLEAIGQRGAIALCAHPNALPFASRRGPVPGFQVELAEALAARLGVALERHWVINSFQYRRADCDLVFDAIADRGALAEVGLRPSRPYQRSGVVLAVRGEGPISSLGDLAPGERVGVQVGSIAAMRLGQQGIAITPYVFEDEMMEALAHREIAAAAVTPATVGWFNLNHPEARVRRIPAFEQDADLNWNVAVGMMRPDEGLRQRVDAALEAMLADGTIAEILARYGVEPRPPN